MSGTATSRPAASRGVTMADELKRALGDALADDPRAMVMGEDVGRLGGVFRLTDGLQDRFGAERVIDTPLAEAGMVGTGVGLALNGMRPIIELQFDGFIFPALNQICCHMARMPLRLGDEDAMPITVRMPVGGRIRASELHSESPETYFAYTPDLRVVSASTADTAYGLLRASISSDRPHIFLEPKRLYRRGRIAPDTVVEDVDPTRARLLREGDDALLISYGPMIDVAMEAAEALAAEGASVALLDLVSLAPLDQETILEHALRSGRVVVAGEGIRRCSIASEVVSLICTEGFEQLQRAPQLVSAPNRPYPPAHVEDDFLPGVGHIETALREVLA